MSQLDKKLPNDAEKLKKIAEQTENPQMKRAIESRLKIVDKDQTVHK